MRRVPTARAAVVGGLLAALTLPTAAFAGWSAGGVGQARSAGAVVAAPSGLRATWDPTVHLTWTPTASAWASGHRLQRSPSPGGPFSTVADLPGATGAALDDNPGAGTWYYRVLAYRGGSWTSAPSASAVRDDPTYVFTGTSDFTGSSCPTATGRTGMQQGFAPGGAGVSLNLSSGTTAAVCSDTFTTGQSLPAGTTTLVVYTSNSKPQQDCTMSLQLRRGAVSLGTGTGTIPGGQAGTAALTWTLSTAATAFATGDRLSLVLTPQSNCVGTTLYAAGATTPSRLTLPR